MLNQNSKKNMTVIPKSMLIKKEDMEEEEKVIDSSRSQKHKLVMIKDGQV